MYQNETLFDVISSVYIKEEVGMGALVMGTRDQVEIQVISKLSLGELSYREAIALEFANLVCHNRKEMTNGTREKSEERFYT